MTPQLTKPSGVGELEGHPSSPAPDLDELLLNAKLRVPLLRGGTVSRVDLVQRARSSGCRVVGITAPAGYGKSTLLAEWAEGEDRQVAGVSFDRFDDDPMALLVLLASAYARIDPGGAELRVEVRGLGGLGAGPCGAATGGGVQRVPGAVRAAAGRRSRAAVPRLSRRVGAGDRGNP